MLEKFMPFHTEIFFLEIATNSEVYQPSVNQFLPDRVLLYGKC